MPRVFGYVRAARGESAAEQLEAVQDFFRRELEPKGGFVYAGTYEDHFTQAGRPLLQRPQGAKLSLKVESGDVVLVARSARAFSGVRDLLRTARIWRGCGAALRLLDLEVNTADEAGVAAMLLLAHAVGIDSAGRSERIGEALHTRRIAGLPAGRPPLGYRIATRAGKKRLVPDEEQRRVGKLVLGWRLEGYAWEAIHFALIRRGVRRPNGDDWSVASLQRLCAAYARIEAAQISRELAAAGAGTPTDG